MHKKVLYALVTLLFLWLDVKSQVTPPCTNPPPPGGTACTSTCVYCDFDGYTGTSGGTASTTEVICGQITVHNDQWLAFIATDPSMEIVVTTSNCNLGEGVQLAFFESCAAPLSALVCNPGGFGDAIPISLSYDQFIPGQTYYLMIDGSFGDVCDFEIDIAQGSVTPPPPDPTPQPQGPTALCPGATAVYTIPPVANAGWYRWTAPPGARINGLLTNPLQIPAPQGTTVTITFGNTALSGNVCVGAGNACFAPINACLPVTLTPIPVTVLPPITLCYEDRMFTWTEAPYQTTTFNAGVHTLNSTYKSYLNCDSIVRQVITVLPQQIKNLGNRYICQGECFVLNGQNYCNPGPQQQPQIYADVCDTLYTFNVVIIPVNAVIPAVPQINCSMPNLTLTSTGSTSPSLATYRWTNASWTIIGSATTQGVTGVGTYNLIVSNTVLGTTCRDTATVTVTSTAAFPGASATGGTITCTTPSVTLQSNSPTSGVNYQWNGPGITPANQFVQNPVVTTSGTYTISVTNPSNGCTSTATAIVIPNDTLPTATAVGGMISCLQPSVTLDGGSNIPNASYSWTGPGINAGNQNQENPSVSQSGSYTLTVLNPSNGCSRTATATVNQDNSAPVANAGADQNITCQQNTVTLNGSATGGGTLQYLWTGPGINAGNQNQQTPVVNVGGTYNLNVLNTSNGCSSNDAVVITELLTLPTASAGPDRTLNCAILSVTLDGSASTQGANFTAAWSGPGINAGNQNLYSPVVSAAGTYTVTITNTLSNCTATDNVTVAQNNTLPTVNAGTDQILTCSSPNGVVLNGSGGPAGVTFQWSGPGINAGNASQQSPTVNLPGTYTLQVNNAANQCTASDQVVVSQDANAPVAAAGVDQTINCAIPSVTLGAPGTSSGPGINYVWTGPGITPANQNTAMPVVSVGGTYVLQVNNTNNSCTASDTTVIAQQVALPTANAGADSILNCAILNVLLDGSASSQGANFTALWSGPGINAGNQNSYTPQVNLPGAYTLTITDVSNNCSATDNVTVVLDNAPPTANAGTDELLTCTTTNGITLNGSGTPATISYFWTGPGITAGNANAPNPTILDAGTYTLLVTNTVNQCTASDQVVIAEDANVPMADAGADLVLNCSVNAVNIDASGSSAGAGIEYQWSGPGISGGNASAQNPQGITVPGTYEVTVTNTNNSCSNTDIVVITIDTVAPLALAGADLVLNCYNNHTDTLDASGSSTGANFSLLWSGPGIAAGNQNLVQPIVNQAGTYTVQLTNTTNNCTTTAVAVVVSDSIAPVSDAGTDGTIDCANSSVSIGGNSSSGANFEYLWTGPGISPITQDLPTLPVNDAGTYTLLVTNTTNGCTSSNDVVVSEDLVYPTADAGTDTVITCTNPTIGLDASASSSGAGIQILWTGSSITPANEALVNPNVTQPDAYILSVLNTVNSCQSVDTVLVTENTLAPDAAAGADTILDCLTTSVLLDGSASSGGAGISYLWSGPDITAANETQQSPSVAQPGTYTLVVTNSINGCSAQDAVQVDQDIVLPVANAGADLLLDCMAPNLTIDGSGSSTGANMRYLWEGAGINSTNFDLLSPTVSDSGTYVLTVTNIQNNCSATDLVFVGQSADLPVTSAGTDVTLTCAVDTIQLDGVLSESGPNITYAWSGPAIVSGEETLASPNVFEPGDYTLTVTNTLNGCSNTDLVTVAQDTIPPFVLAGDDQVLTCANSTTGVPLSSNGSSSGPEFSILWSGSGITPENDTLANPVVTGVGPYVLTITNLTNGCTGTDVVVVEQDQDAPTALAGEDQTITCAVTSVTLDGSASSSPSGTQEYTWEGPGINASNLHDASVTVTVDGNYTLTVVNPVSGCQAIDNVLVNLDTAAPEASATGDTITCEQPSGTLTGSSSVGNSLFQWEGPGINNTNMNLASLQVSQPGSYSVTVTSVANGCTDVAATTVEADENFPTGVVEGDELNCLNDGTGSIAGTVSTPGATFYWTGPNNFNATTATVSVTVEGTYLFNVVASNGCVNPIPVLVTSNFTEPTIQASVPGNLNCTTTSLTISGAGTSSGPSITYAWTSVDGNIVSGANTLNPVVDAPGAYTLLVTNILNGCTASRSFQVANDPNVPTALNLDVRDIRCFGDNNGAIDISGVAGGVEPFVFSLNGATSSIVDQYSNLPAGEYTISLEDANGCVLDTVVSISEPAQLTVELGDDQSILLGDSATVAAQIMNETPISKVEWNLAPNRDSTECCTFSYLPLQTYRHQITVVDSNGCVARDMVNIFVRKDRQVFVPNIINLNSDDPLNAVLMIQGGKDVVKIHKWLIFDRWGNAIHEVQNFLPNDMEHAWNGNVRGEKGQPAVFVWAAEIEFLDGLIELFEGDVTIMR